MPLTIEQQDKLTLWNRLNLNLKTLKEEEMKLRNEIVSEFFDPGKTEGTEYADLANGYRLKVVKKENYNLDNKNGKVDAALEKLNEGIADLVVNWNPSLSISNYRKLTDSEKSVFNDCLEIKPGSPTLEIVPPR